MDLAFEHPERFALVTSRIIELGAVAHGLGIREIMQVAGQLDPRRLVFPAKVFGMGFEPLLLDGFRCIGADAPSA